MPLAPSALADDRSAITRSPPKPLFLLAPGAFGALSCSWGTSRLRRSKFSKMLILSPRKFLLLHFFLVQNFAAGFRAGRQKRADPVSATPTRVQERRGLRFFSRGQL